jgi:DNA modification methylase
MNVTEREITTIEPYGKNAKKHPDSQVQQIANSIQEFGFNQPIVVDKAGVIIVGHGRYLAAHLLGINMVPVIEVDISEEKAKAYRLADNKLNESDWDMDLVIAELKDLNNMGFNIDLTGFSAKLILENTGKDDEVPSLPLKAKSKVGDLYEMGPHKLLCGDSTKEESYVQLMKGAKADMVFTDPPYNVNYKGAGEKTSTTIMNDKMGDSQFLSFLTDAFKQITASIKRGGGLYIFHDPSTQAIFEAAMKSANLEVIAQLIWNKPSGGLGMGDYRSKHEPFFYAGVQDTKPNFYGDRTNVTIVDFQKTEQQLTAWAKKVKEAEKNGKTTIWTMKREPTKDYVHPTQKPVELIMYALHNSSKVDDIVMDPFMGSGSTMIGCEKTNRACYGIELDPRFVDVIVQRWVDFTGNRNITKNGEKIVW